MGYACPVCEEPQVDARHLANHLAFTALLGDEDHETWLEAHAPGWDQEDDEGLAELVVEHAPEVDLPEDVSFEDDHGIDGPAIQEPGVDSERTGTLDRPGDLAGGGHDTIDEHDPGVTFDDIGGGPTARSDSPLDADAKDVLREAYEMTRKRRERAAEREGEPGETRSDDPESAGERTGADPAGADAGETE